MSLLAWPALLLLAAAAVLVALAVFAPGPKQFSVGTLLIWRRVAAQQKALKQRRKSFDPLLWLLLAAVVMGAAAAARPAWMLPDSSPRVAVFIERLEPMAIEPELDQAIARAREEAPGAELKFFITGEIDDEFVRLNPGTVQSELAQFVARTEDFDGRLMLLHTPLEADTWGRVLPRVTLPRRDAAFGIAAQGDQFSFRTPGMTAPGVTGATLVGSSSVAGETIWSYEGTDNEVSVSIGERLIRLEREPFVVGVGADWISDTHRALFEALGTDSAAQGEPRLWLTGELQPAVRILRGELAELDGATLSFDPGHPLFHDLPLEDFDWLHADRVMPPDPSARPLLSVERAGQPMGDIIRLRGGNLEFAGDPFSTAPIASAALLLDNAIGVVAGVRPSERPGYRLTSPELPSRRAALSAPFAPVGELDLSSRSEAAAELSSWLMLAAAAVLLLAAWRVSGSGLRPL